MTNEIPPGVCSNRNQGYFQVQECPTIIDKFLHPNLKGLPGGQRYPTLVDFVDNPGHGRDEIINALLRLLKFITQSPSIVHWVGVESEEPVIVRSLLEVQL